MQFASVEAFRLKLAVHESLLQPGSCSAVALHFDAALHLIPTIRFRAWLQAKTLARQQRHGVVPPGKAAWILVAQLGGTHAWAPIQAVQGSTAFQPDSVMHAQVAFVEPPSFSLALTLYGGDISILPGLEAYLQNFVRDSILRCSCPCCY